MLAFYPEPQPHDYLYDGMMAQIPVGGFYLQASEMLPRSIAGRLFVLETDSAATVNIYVNDALVVTHIPRSRRDLIVLPLADPPNSSAIRVENGFDPAVYLSVAATYLNTFMNVHAAQLYQIAGRTTQIYNDLLTSPWTAYIVEWLLPWARYLPDVRTMRALSVKAIANTIYGESGRQGGIVDFTAAFTGSTPVVTEPRNKPTWEPHIVQMQTAGDDHTTSDMHVWFPNLCMRRWLAMLSVVRNTDVYQLRRASEEVAIVRRIEQLMRDGQVNPASYIGRLETAAVYDQSLASLFLGAHIANLARDAVNNQSLATLISGSGATILPANWFFAEANIGSGIYDRVVMDASVHEDGETYFLSYTSTSLGPLVNVPLRFVYTTERGPVVPIGDWSFVENDVGSGNYNRVLLKTAAFNPDDEYYISYESVIGPVENVRIEFSYTTERVATEFFEQHLFDNLESGCSFRGLLDRTGCMDNMGMTGRVLIQANAAWCHWANPLDSVVETPGIGGTFLDTDALDSAQHSYADTDHRIKTAWVSTLPECLTIANEIDTEYNAHDSDPTPTWHYTAGPNHQTTVPIGATLGSLILWCQDAAAQYAAHVADTVMHDPDGIPWPLTRSVTVDSTLDEVAAFLNEFKNVLNEHFVHGNFDGIYDIDLGTDYWVGAATSKNLDAGGCLDAYTQVAFLPKDLACCIDGPDTVIFETTRSDTEVVSAVKPNHPLFGGDSPGLLENPYFGV